MARRVKEFPFGVRRGNPKYPWNKWTDGETWEVVHGKDFTCTPGSLVVYLYHKARELNTHVRTSIVRGTGKKPDRVVFQFVKAKDVPTKKKTLKRKAS